MSDDDWVDDYGTGRVRPDLESLLAAGGPLEGDEFRAVLWWAFALEGRVHHLELLLRQQGPTAGEVLVAARAGDEAARQAAEAARSEGERRVAERVEALQDRLRPRRIELGARSASVVFSTDLSRFSSEGSGTIRDPRVAGLQRGVRVIVTDEDADQFWAVVVGVDGDVASVVTDWSRVPSGDDLGDSEAPPAG